MIMWTRWGKDIRTALDPERINEAKFTIPEDNEATKAIPIITNLHSMNPKEETIIHSKDSGSQDIDQTGVNEDKKKDKKKEKKKMAVDRWWVLRFSNHHCCTRLSFLANNVRAKGN